MTAAASATESWIISTVAGTGAAGFGGDGGPALGAQLNGPFDVAFDRTGNLYFSDTFNHRIRHVDAAGTITTVAGTGTAGHSGDGGPALAAQLNEPYGIAVDRAGTLYLADRLNRRVRRVDARSGIITTLAGTGAAEQGGDGGPAAQAGLVEPNGLAFDPDEARLLIADVAGHRIRVVTIATSTIPTAMIATFAGTGAGEHSGDGGPAAAAGIFGARAVRVAPDGTVFVLERQGSTLRRVDPRSGTIATIAGQSGQRGFAGDGGPLLAAIFNAPKEMALDRNGDVLVVDTENHVIRRVARSAGRVTTIAGNGAQGGGGDGGPALAASLDRPHGAVVGADGAIYIGDTNNHRIRKLTCA